MCVPLVARHRALGAITFVSGGERPALRARPISRRPRTSPVARAISIDNARLFREAQASRQHAQESLAVVDAVFAAAPVGLAFMDTNFRYVRVNQALAAPERPARRRALRPHAPRRARRRRWPTRSSRSTARCSRPASRSSISTIERRAAAVPERNSQLARQLLPGLAMSTTDKIGVGVVITDVSEREQARAAAERPWRAAGGARGGEPDARLDARLRVDAREPRLPPRAAVRGLVRGRHPRRRRHASAASQSCTRIPPRPSGPTSRATSIRRTSRKPKEQAARPAPAKRCSTARSPTSCSRRRRRIPAHYEILHELGMASAMVVPLTAAGPHVRRADARLLPIPERLYDEDDLEFAKHLGRRAAVAVDNARALSRRRGTRARAAIVVEHVADGVLLVDHRRHHPPLEPGRRADHRPARRPTPSARARQRSSLGWDDDRSRCVDSARAAPADPGRSRSTAASSGSRSPASASKAERVFAFRDLDGGAGSRELKSDFVSTVSHELRTPLAAIYGAALTLQARGRRARRAAARADCSR